MPADSSCKKPLAENRMILNVWESRPSRLEPQSEKKKLELNREKSRTKLIEEPHADGLYVR